MEDIKGTPTQMQDCQWMNGASEIFTFTYFQIFCLHILINISSLFDNMIVSPKTIGKLRDAQKWFCNSWEDFCCLEIIHGSSIQKNVWYQKKNFGTSFVPFELCNQTVSHYSFQHHKIDLNLKISKLA